MRFYQIQEPQDEKNIIAKNLENIAIGIDLGTTNSLVGVSNNGVVRLIKIDNSTHLLPSVVYHDNDETYVGNSAINFDGAVKSVKKLMGKNKNDSHEFSNIFTFAESEETDDTIKLQSGSKVVSHIDISASILKKLKTAAEKDLNAKVTKAVITVPAYFNDAARNDTLHAAQIAGLEVLRLINEPTAAAFAYGLQNNLNGVFAVYDIGGGTFDISILKMQDGVLRVIAVAGDTNLGGDDFDIALLVHLLNKYKMPMPSGFVFKKALNESKYIKEYLTNNEVFQDENLSFFKNCIVTREEFETATQHLIDKTIMLFKNALIDANCKASKIDEEEALHYDLLEQKEKLDAIIMVGGSTRMKAVKNALNKHFDVKILDSFNPDEIVAMGAAIQAEALCNSNSNGLLIDVSPLSLGIEVIQGLVECIIPRNTPIPTKISKMFTTSQDNQSAFQMHILQGESDKVALCRSLAKFELKNIPKMPAGVPRLLVTFNIDADGILTVTAEETTTKIRQYIEIRPSYGLSDSIVRDLLIEGK